MDKDTNRMFLKEGIPRLASLYGLRADTLGVIQDHRNLVFEGVNSSGRSVIFKAVPARLSQHGHLLGELDWVAFLHSKGISVPRPHLSSNGNLVESLGVEGWALSAYCLDKVNGKLWSDCPAEEVDISSIGFLAGQMASVSVDYQRSSAEAYRPTWRDAAWFLSPHHAIHESMPKVIDRVIELRAKLDSLPREFFGIVHDDLHAGNIIISNANPVPIDFENANYTWHAADIASALFFELWKTPGSSARDLAHAAREFVARFLEGYSRVWPLNAFWIQQIPTFLKVRELSMFASSGMENQDFRTVGSNNPNFAFMKTNIEESVPYVELDFCEFAS